MFKQLMTLSRLMFWRKFKAALGRGFWFCITFWPAQALFESEIAAAILAGAVAWATMHTGVTDEEVAAIAAGKPLY